MQYRQNRTQIIKHLKYKWGRTNSKIMSLLYHHHHHHPHHELWNVRHGVCSLIPKMKLILPFNFIVKSAKLLIWDIYPTWWKVLLLVLNFCIIHKNSWWANWCKENVPTLYRRTVSERLPVIPRVIPRGFSRNSRRLSSVPQNRLRQSR